MWDVYVAREHSPLTGLGPQWFIAGRSWAVVLVWSLLPVLGSEFRWCCVFTVVLLIWFGLLSGHLLGNSCPLGWAIVLVVFCLFVIFYLFPILVLRVGFGF